MISIKKLAEQITLMYTGGRLTTEGIDPRIVEAWVEQALDNVITEEFFMQYKQFGEHTTSSHYHVPFIVGLSENAALNSKIAILPEQYVILPSDKGIVSVSKGKGYNDELDYIKFSEWNALKSSGLLKFAGRYFYSPLNKELIIRGDCPADKIPFSSVMVTLVIANNLTMEDGHALAVTQKVLTLMDRQFRTSPDMTSDQNPQPTFR